MPAPATLTINYPAVQTGASLGVVVSATVTGPAPQALLARTALIAQGYVIAIDGPLRHPDGTVDVTQYQIVGELTLSI